MEENRNRAGEVVEANSSSFVAQCYQLHNAPALGALVCTDSPRLYGVVCRVATEPLDPSRPVLARGEHEATEEDLFEANPQLERLLTTRFDALIVGYRNGETSRHVLPPHPPRVHAFVYACLPTDVAEFVTSLGFLDLLLRSGIPLVDEIVASCLRGASTVFADGDHFLLRAGRALAEALIGDAPRLRSILQRVHG